jgi:hypothetical protein
MFEMQLLEKMSLSKSSLQAMSVMLESTVGKPSLGPSKEGSADSITARNEDG